MDPERVVNSLSLHLTIATTNNPELCRGVSLDFVNLEIHYLPTGYIPFVRYVILCVHRRREVSHRGTDILRIIRDSHNNKWKYLTNYPETLIPIDQVYQATWASLQIRVGVEKWKQQFQQSVDKDRFD